MACHYQFTDQVDYRLEIASSTMLNLKFNNTKTIRVFIYLSGHFCNSYEPYKHQAVSIRAHQLKFLYPLPDDHKWIPQLMRKQSK
jgi:hypothetical protein